MTTLSDLSLHRSTSHNFCVDVATFLGRATVKAVCGTKGQTNERKHVTICVTETHVDLLLPQPIGGVSYAKSFEVVDPVVRTIWALGGFHGFSSNVSLSFSPSTVADFYSIHLEHDSLECVVVSLTWSWISVQSFLEKVEICFPSLAWQARIDGATQFATSVLHILLHRHDNFDSNSRIFECIVVVINQWCEFENTWSRSSVFLKLVGFLLALGFLLRKTR